MKKVIIFILILLSISCKTFIPINKENKSCIVNLIKYIHASSYEFPSSYLELNIKNSEVDNLIKCDVMNYISKEYIKEGLYDEFSVYLRFGYGYILDEPLNYYNQKLNYKIKINPNSIIIFPYKVLIEYNKDIILLKLKNLTEDEVHEIIFNLKKDKNFYSYKDLYLGNEKILLK